MQVSLTDKLMDISNRHSERIAELWYKSLIANPRTTSCCTLPREGLLRHASTIYRAVADMYFADNCFQTVEHVLDVSGFAEDFFARNIPLEEVLYAVVLLRRHLWLYADSQAVFSSSIMDMYNALDSINRVTLVFDYVLYVTARTYGELAEKRGHSPVARKVKAI